MATLTARGIGLVRSYYQSLPPGVRDALRPAKPFAKKVARKLGYSPTPHFGPPVVHKPAEGDIWGQRHLDEHYWNGMIHWGQIPIVAARLNERISGDPNVDHFAYTRRKYIDPMRKKHGPIKMLSVCCGVGQLEREMLKNGFCDEVLAYDVSAPCIDQANALAAAEGLGSKARFIAADLNSLRLPEGEGFDVIFNEAALHHISNLEHLIQECRRVCKPHSLFVNHDFIGPNHHQWTERQLSIINAILARLPNTLKGSRTNPGAVHFSRKALTMAEMLEIDPTEGVRSQDTLSVMQRWFDIVERKDFGGTILHILFNDIAGNFMAPEHDALVRVLVYLEDLLLETADLPSDFSYWVACPK